MTNADAITASPPDEFLADHTLSMLIHAGSKVGKSTLSSTCPLPILVLDAEGGWRFIHTAGRGGSSIRKCHWDPNTGGPPIYDGTWDVCIVTVRQWSTITQVYQWLTQAPHSFVSIIIDSITEVQRRCKKNLVGTEAMKIQHWGTLLTLMDDLIRNYRDLVLIRGISVRCVFFIAETVRKDNKWRPSMQGQIGTALPYWVDICGYFYVDQEVDSEGQPLAQVRKLLVATHPEFESGERVQGVLGDVVREPNIREMMHTIFRSPEIQSSMQEVIK